MSSHCEEEDPRLLEWLLRQSLGNPSLVVLKVSCAAATSVGDNFLSVVKRVTVSGTVEDERLRSRGAFRP